MVKLQEAIEEAISLSVKSSGPFKHGCVILSGKKIVSRGNNHIRTSIGTPSVHAELDALWKINNTDMYTNLKAIIVRSNSKRLANSRPCTMCMNALRQHGVKTIVYSVEGGRVEMEKI